MATPTARSLGTLEVISGKLRVRVSSHVIASASGPVPCWTYVSDGLRAVGQKEVAFSVKREAGEQEDAFPRELLGFYATLHRLAEADQVVDVGGRTRLGPDGPGFFRRDLRGILYVAGQPFLGVPVDAPFLTAVIVTDAEMNVAEQLGHVRLLSLLGRRYAFFPTPPWLDRGRAELVRPEAMASSILTRVRTLDAPRAAVRMETRGDAGPRVVLKLRRETAGRLDAALSQVPAGQPVALLVGLDPRCDAALVWSPGQHEPAGISAAGSAGDPIAGNFLMLVPGVDEDTAKLFEDGFGVLMKGDTWTRFRAALAAQEPFDAVGVGGAMGFSIAWLDETFKSPVDGKVFAAEGGWEKVSPSGAAVVPPEDPSGIVKLRGVRLLTSESELAGRLRPDELAAFVRRAAAALGDVLGGEEGAFDVLVQLELTPSASPRIGVGVQPEEASAVPVAVLVRTVEAAGAPSVSGPVRLIVGYAVRGGTGERLP